MRNKVLTNFFSSLKFSLDDHSPVRGTSTGTGVFKDPVTTHIGGSFYSFRMRSEW
jgi:hypothetical protein